MQRRVIKGRPIKGLPIQGWDWRFTDWPWRQLVPVFPCLGYKARLYIRTVALGNCGRIMCFGENTIYSDKSLLLCVRETFKEHIVTARHLRIRYVDCSRQQYNFQDFISLANSLLEILHRNLNSQQRSI